jgi:hypothetical protein
MANSINHLQELEAEGFREVDEFNLVSEGHDLWIDLLGRGRTKATKHSPSVYAWVSCRDGASEVIYVGMASKGWLIRRGQHFQGLRLPVGAGAKNRLGIIDEILGKARVKVLERTSGAETYFGMRAPTHGAEEWALLARFQPRLNRGSDINRALQFHRAA